VLAADLRLADGRPVPGFTDRIILSRSGVKVGIFAICRHAGAFLAQLGLSHAGADLVKLRAEAGHNICAEDGRVLWTAQIAAEYYFWPGRDYNLFRFYSADGSWAGDYYNLATPIAARDGVITYADLELDVYLPLGEPARLLDDDELEAAPYPPELKARIRRVGDWLLTVAGSDDAPGGCPPNDRTHQKSGV
jgi:hypothetical protein